jgi:LysR substrate binding domain
MGSAGPYRWEFDRGIESLAVGVRGPLVLDDMDVTIRAAVDGVGLAFTLEEYVAPHLASGVLVRVLEDWCPPFAGFFLYYTSRRQQRPHCQRLSRRCGCRYSSITSATRAGSRPKRRGVFDVTPSSGLDIDLSGGSHCRFVVSGR